MKRESERRHRDKDKFNQNYDPNTMSTEFNNPDEINSMYEDEPSASKAKSTIRNASHSMPNTNSTQRSDNMFQSNTAREIFNERGHPIAKEQQTSTKIPTSSGTNTANNQSNQYKRFTPRKKKRHNTAPTSENFMDYMAERNSHKFVSLFFGISMNSNKID